MTTKSQPRNNADTGLEHNDKRAREALDKLSVLIAEATHPSFTGSVSLWIGSHAGRLGTFKTERSNHHKD